MFENGQIVAIEGKCRRFRNSSEFLKTNLDAKGAKKSVKMWTTNFYKSCFLNSLLYMNGQLSKIQWYIHMLCPGQFILIESVNSLICRLFVVK